jgi:hypothetical protein
MLSFSRFYSADPNINGIPSQGLSAQNKKSGLFPHSFPVNCFYRDKHRLEYNSSQVKNKVDSNNKIYNYQLCPILKIF